MISGGEEHLRRSLSMEDSKTRIADRTGHRGPADDIELPAKGSKQFMACFVTGGRTPKGSLLVGAPESVDLPRFKGGN